MIDLRKDGRRVLNTFRGQTQAIRPTIKIPLTKTCWSFRPFIYGLRLSVAIGDWR